MTRERIDARRLFFFSIIYLPALLGVMMAGKL
jgi:heme O synthase-like polyprenyltransferase